MRNTRPATSTTTVRARGGVALRRWKWIVLLGWVLMAVLATPLAEKIGDVEREDIAAFLPTGAESTEVAALIESAGGEETSTALVVYAASDRLTDGDLAAIADQRAQVAAELQDADGISVSGVEISDDGAAALIVVDGLSEDVAEDVVPELRDMVAEPSVDVDVYVSGEAALSVDNNAGDVDAALLLTSMLIVAVLLLVTYRSPVLWLLPLLAAVLAVQVARGAIYLLGDAGVTVTELSSAILIVLVFGAATDYAMLLLNRYREELVHYEDHHDAIMVAVQRTAPALLASAGTVVLGLLCLLVASLAGLRGLGPIAAAGVVIALAAMLTAFPALLAVLGRGVFWPRVPSPQHPERVGRHRIWARAADLVVRRPRPIAALVTAALVALAFLTTGVSVSADPIDKVPPGSESVDGYAVAHEHFREGLQPPLTVVMPEGAGAAEVDEVTAVAQQLVGVGAVTPSEELPGDRASLRVDLSIPAYGDVGHDLLHNLRSDAADAVPGTIVGGMPAVQLDYKDAALDDVLLVAPLLLLVVSLVIGLLLRSVVAALLVLGTVLLSLVASFGISWAIFEHVRGYGPVAADLFVYILVFLVALGVDYNIFLAARIREERRRRDTTGAIWHGLTHTGGVITAAGLVLAGTFFTLAQLPDVTVAEVGIAVAVGVLMDALVVRTFLFPALVRLLGDRTWWPGTPAPATIDTAASRP
ncbi:MMPL family transporter [Nocardioides sp. BYT-33-1]|uniref:MMPL family transporter n=1 Tax=Nocardioides sp. BYT-33-1 TaxID=3416952 RepID=UPI003F53DA6E